LGNAINQKTENMNPEIIDGTKEPENA